MNTQATREPALVPGYRGGDLRVYVCLCETCGQPLWGPHDCCHSARDVGSDGLGIGGAVRSTELARLARAALTAVGGPQLRRPLTLRRGPVAFVARLARAEPAVVAVAGRQG